MELLQKQIMFNIIVHTIENLKMTSLPAVRNIVNMHVAGFKKYYQAMKKVHCLAHTTQVRGVSKLNNLSLGDNFPTGSVL